MTASPLQFPSRPLLVMDDYFHRAMNDLNDERIDQGFTPIKFSGLCPDDKKRVLSRARQLESRSDNGVAESRNTNAIEVTEYTSATMVNTFDERLLAVITVDRCSPHRVHFRIAAEALKEIRRMPRETRTEIVEVLDRLLEDFKRRLLIS